MSVAVAHQASPIGELALREAAREAALRRTRLDIIHVMESLDLDIAEAHRTGLSDTVQAALQEGGLSDLDWELHLATGDRDVADTVIKLAVQVKASLLVIGARRRSPVGKFLLGSVTQSVILDAPLPVLVIKPSA